MNQLSSSMQLITYILTFKDDERDCNANECFTSASSINADKSSASGNGWTMWTPMIGIWASQFKSFSKDKTKC